MKPIVSQLFKNFSILGDIYDVEKNICYGETMLLLLLFFQLIPL